MNNLKTSFQIFLLIYLFFFAIGLHAQVEETQIEEQEYLITTKTLWKGRKFNKVVKETRATIHKESKDSVWLYVLGESIGYKKSEIVSIELWDYSGRFTRADRNMHRHIFSPTAINIKKGEGYYQNVYLSGNKFTYGFTDNFSLDVGLDALSLALWEEFLLMIHPRFSFELDEMVHLGFGVLLGAYFWEIFDDLDQIGGVAYTNLTFGSDDVNFTIGLGSGYYRDNRTEKILAGLFGSNMRISKGITFTTEFTPFRSTRVNSDRVYRGLINISALKFSKRKNTFDLGYLLYAEEGEIDFLVPFLGYVRYM